MVRMEMDKRRRVLLNFNGTVNRELSSRFTDKSMKNELQNESFSSICNQLTTFQLTFPPINYIPTASTNQRIPTTQSCIAATLPSAIQFRSSTSFTAATELETIAGCVSYTLEAPKLRSCCEFVKETYREFNHAVTILIECFHL